MRNLTIKLFKHKQLGISNLPEVSSIFRSTFISTEVINSRLIYSESKNTSICLMVHA